MGASNNQSSSSNYYKLKEDKNDNSPSKGEFRFFKQGKKDGKWGDSESFNSFSGTLIGVDISEYIYNGKKKESLQLKFKDVGETNVVSLGFDSMIARNILNGLAGEPSLGVISFNCGKPREYNGKSFPTVYVKNQGGNLLDWKYSKSKNNFDQIPKVETTTDDDGNTIKVGVKKSNDFWKDVITKDILPKLAGKDIAPKNEPIAVDGPDDLPF